MTFSKLIVTTAASAMMGASAVLATVLAQDAEQPAQQLGAQAQGENVATQCLENLREFRLRMDRDGYWLTGRGGQWGWGMEPHPDMQPMPTPEAPEAAEPPPDQPVPDAEAGAWGLAGLHTPSFQIRALFTGAHVLALRGEEEGCQTAIAEMGELYDEFVESLREAGVRPGDVVHWRHEALAAARPVEELEPLGIDIADISGAELRNPRDENLGTIDDVLVGPDRTILYVIVARDGFLGIGEEHVAIPWQGLKATPGLNFFVLDVDEDVVEQAPRIDPDLFARPDVFERQRQEVDEYWQQHMAA